MFLEMEETLENVNCCYHALSCYYHNKCIKPGSLWLLLVDHIAMNLAQFFFTKTIFLLSLSLNSIRVKKNHIKLERSYIILCNFV